MTTHEDTQAQAAFRHLDETETRLAKTQLAAIDALLELIDAIAGKK